MLSGLAVDRKITVGDLLTSFTIIVSVVALTASWSRDHTLRQREQADHIRNAAAKTIAKLERWQDLSLSVFQELEPVYIEVSEALATTHNVVLARDLLWRRVNESRIGVADKILREELEIAYVDLLAYYPAIRDNFIQAVDKLKEAEEIVLVSFLELSQRDVLSFQNRLSRHTSTDLGNKLRSTASTHKIELTARSREALEPIRKRLFELLRKSDREILTGGGSIVESGQQVQILTALHGTRRGVPQ